MTGCSPSLLPTPRASENEQRTTKRTPSQEAGTHGKHLAAEVMSLLPTPTVNDARNLSAPSQEDRNGPGLPTVIRLLPTPVAHDDGKTPEAHLAMKAGMDGGPRSQITSLTVLAKAGFRQPVKLLPTPVKGDGKGSRQATAKNPRCDSPTLTDLAWSGELTTPPSAAGSASTAPRPTLSPDFVGWMMGTPACSVCGAEWTDPDCPHSVTEFTSTPPGLSGAS